MNTKCPKCDFRREDYFNDIDGTAAVSLKLNPSIYIFIVWTIGKSPNGLPALDIRAVTTSMAKAKMYSKMLRRDKAAYNEDWDRIHIEPRVANHLYGQKCRELLANMGRI